MTLLVHHSVAWNDVATRETDATNKPSPWILIAAAHARLQHCWMWWPNKYNNVVHFLEQKKRRMILKTMFDCNQTSFNNIMVAKRVQHVRFNNVGWCYTNMFNEPVWPRLNGKKRNSGRKRKNKNSTLRSPHTVSVFSITSPPVPGYFFKDMLWWWWWCYNRVCDVLPFACTVNPLFVLQLAAEKTRQMGKINK